MKLLREPLVHFLLLGPCCSGSLPCWATAAVNGLATSWSRPATSSI